MTAPVIDDPANEAPEFVEGQTAVRYVEEDAEAGESIGAPLEITDADGVSAGSHNFTLSGTDAASFDIEPVTFVTGAATQGVQLMTKAALNFEDKTTYTVVVTVKDSSNKSNDTDSITVTIQVKDLDEKPVLMVRRGPAINNPPTFPAATAARSVDENTAAGANIGAPVEASDDGALTYTLRGANAASFNINATTGQLRTRSALDYETKNSYTVTVRATDGEMAIDEIDVTIAVTNLDEPGAVRLSSTSTAPQVGVAITASVEDPDRGVTGTTWQWASSNATDGAFAPIPGATSRDYTPMDADADNYLRATASYTDEEGPGKSATSEVSGRVVTITSPMFNQGLATEILVPENRAAGDIGIPFTATDADGDTVFYSLANGTDASFDINSATGQLSTTAELDYETAMSYTITVQVTDNEDATGGLDPAVDATHAVTINVANEDESGTVSLSAQPAVVGIELTAELDDPDGGLATMAWQWASSNVMVGPFTDIMGATNAAYTPVEGDNGKYLQATARYTDGEGTDKMAMSDPQLVVTYSAPAFAADAANTIEVAENTAEGENLGDPYTATDDNTPVYGLSGTDAASFTIDSGTGQLMTKAALDYETKMTYMVTVEVRDNEDATGGPDTVVDDTVKVTITVTNVDEDGTVSLDAATPRVGVAITASVTDPDRGVHRDHLAVGQRQCRRRELRVHRGRHERRIHPGGCRRGQLPAGDGQLHRRRRPRQERNKRGLGTSSQHHHLAHIR